MVARVRVLLLALAAALLLAGTGQAPPPWRDGDARGAAPRWVDGWTEPDATEGEPRRPMDAAAQPSSSRSGVPLTPRFVDIAHAANVTHPCCTNLSARVNATDPDDSGFYDTADARAAANGTTPRNVTVPRLGPYPAERVDLPNATWEAEATARAWDSYVSDSFDRLTLDVLARLEHEGVPYGYRLTLDCTDADPVAYGPEDCVWTLTPA